VKEPIGKQDQYACAFGGLNLIRFHPDESVEVLPVACPEGVRDLLGRRLMLFYIGQERAASSILAEQARNMADADTFAKVTEMAELAEEIARTLQSDNLDSFGELMHRGWILKSGLAQGITNQEIDCNYRLAREAGAEGGKLLGAGGGGFLLIYCREEKKADVREALKFLREMPFALTREGSQIIHTDGQHGPVLSRSLDGVVQPLAREKGS